MGEQLSETSPERKSAFGNLDSDTPSLRVWNPYGSLRGDHTNLMVPTIARYGYAVGE
jgi:hypothetical protein